MRILALEFPSKNEKRSRKARSEMSTKGTHSPVANFFSVLYRLKWRIFWSKIFFKTHHKKQDFVLNIFLRLLWIFGENPWLVLIWTFSAMIWPVSCHFQHITASFSFRPLSSGFIKYSFPGPRILFKLMMCFSVFTRFLSRWENHLFYIIPIIQVAPRKNILFC